MTDKLLPRLFVALAGWVALAAHAALPIQHWTTPEGAQVYFVESHSLPMLDVSVDFPAGSGYDSAEEAGLCQDDRGHAGSGGGCDE